MDYKKVLRLHFVNHLVTVHTLLIRYSKNDEI